MMRSQENIDADRDFGGEIRFILRSVWGWWETYVSLAAFILILAALYNSVPITNALVNRLQRAVNAIEVQGKEASQERQHIIRELDTNKKAINNIENSINSTE